MTNLQEVYIDFVVNDKTIKLMGQSLCQLLVKHLMASV